MTSWNNILSQYQFSSKLYDKFSHSSLVNQFFVDIVPNYPIATYCSITPRFVKHLYRYALPYILPSSDDFYDFPVLLLLHLLAKLEDNIPILPTHIGLLTCITIPIFSKAFA